MTVKPSARFLSRARVLVVDDEPAVCRVVTQILERYGWKVWEAETSAEALTLVEHSPEPLDLAILDLMLGGDEAGLILARELLKVKPDLPILFMSGYTDLEARLEETPKVPTDFIGKPISMTELIRKASALVTTRGDRRGRTG